MTFDKKYISASFSDAAKTYESWAKHQHLAANTLVKLLPEICANNNILDAGCGTGLVTQIAYNRYKTGNFIGIDISEQMVSLCKDRFKNIKNMNFCVCDLEKLDKKNLFPSFNLILSNFTLQWLGSIEHTIKALFGLLELGGYLGLAVPIEGSLFELRESFYNVFYTEMPGLHYKSFEYYASPLKQLSAIIPISYTENICFYFNKIDILRYFKYTGTVFNYSPSYRPKTIKEINALLKYYEQTYGRDSNLLPLTFKVLFIIAQKQA